MTETSAAKPKGTGLAIADVTTLFFAWGFELADWTADRGGAPPGGRATATTGRVVAGWEASRNVSPSD